jgi:hypothetical protein
MKVDFQSMLYRNQGHALDCRVRVYFAPSILTVQFRPTAVVQSHVALGLYQTSFRKGLVLSLFVRYDTF